MLSFLTWNVNSIKMRKDQVKDLLLSTVKEHDFCCFLQEIKCIEDNFPDIYKDLCTNILVLGQKRYNGIAMLTNRKIYGHKTSFKGNPCEDESRYLEVEFENDVIMIGVYIPNGTSVKHDNFNKKLLFLEYLSQHLDCLNKSGKTVIIGGDFNVAPFDIDVYSASDMKCTLSFTTQEKSLIRNILNRKYIDLYRVKNYNNKEFSWWDYRGGSLQNNAGLRIDYILSNRPMLCKKVSMLKKYRYLETPSDHIPIEAIIDI